jgi:hypothetical protein
MANELNSDTEAGIGTSLTSIYTCPSNTVVTLIGLTIANVHTDNIKVSVKLDDDSTGNEVFIVKNAPVPVGGALNVAGGNMKLVLQENDVIKVQSDVASSADVIMSYLEQS